MSKEMDFINIDEILAAIGATPAEIEELSPLLNCRRYATSEPNPAFYTYHVLSYNSMNICSVDASMTANIPQITRFIYRSKLDLPVLLFLVKITSVILTAYIYDEEDVLPLKAIESLLYDKRVFFIKSYCNKSGANPRIKCTILDDTIPYESADMLYDPIFLLVKSHTALELQNYKSHKNILVYGDKIGKKLIDKNVNSITILTNNNIHLIPFNESKLEVKFCDNPIGTNHSIVNSNCPYQDQHCINKYKYMHFSNVVKLLTEINISSIKSAKSIFV